MSAGLPRRRFPPQAAMFWREASDGAVPPSTDALPESLEPICETARDPLRPSA